jgi:voltage-gated potassium channel Kch
VTRSTINERLRYRFDGWMSRGTIALMGLLGLATLVFVIVLGIITWIVLAIVRDEASPDSDIGPVDFIWRSLMRTLDPGTMGGDEGWAFRILMLIVTIGGLIIVASLIGIVSGAFDSKIEELRKGRSRVLEREHTLILGWNSKIFSIIQETAIANESRGKSHIVVLADRDKVEMEDEIRAAGGALGRTVVICRTGDPKSLNDLAIASPQTARSIILLAPEGSADPDADVIKTALALTNGPDRPDGGFHIVGELADPSNLEVARLVGRDEAHWVIGPELIGRITVQSCRQSGLSVVYQELLDFDGDEIYITEQPELVGATYLDAQLRFDDCTAIGLVVAGAVVLNPPAATVIGSGDRVIVIAEDDSTIRLGQRWTPSGAALVERERAQAQPERTLVLGVNPGLVSMLRELDEYVAVGSSVHIVAQRKAIDLPELDHLEITWQRADATKRAVLDELQPASFDHIIVLADTTDHDPQRADSRTLVTLLQLRDIADRGDHDLNIVSEMLDDGNRELAEVTEADDFIVSDKLVSLVLAQTAENRELTGVYDTLFSSAGSEIYLMPADEYVELGVEVGMTALIEAAQRRGETAIGFRIAEHAHSPARQYGVTVNPPKSHSIAFSAGDRVIVLAEG